MKKRERKGEKREMHITKKKKDDFEKKKISNINHNRNDEK